MHGKGTEQINTVTVTFDSNNGTGEKKEISVPKNTSIKLPKNTFKYEGYDFMGWQDSVGSPYSDEDNCIFSEDTTFYAWWKKHVDFSMKYGRIEVVWLDINNNVIEKPNQPNLGNMTPVKWNGFTEVTTTSNDTEWYNYKAKTGTDDNLDSHWANAKNTVNNTDSYFVWIPRYAYRITYYANETSDEITGYCDRRWNTRYLWKCTTDIRRYGKIS